MSKISDAIDLAHRKRVRHQAKPHGTGNEGAYRTWSRIARALKGDGLESTLTWAVDKQVAAEGKPWRKNFDVAVAGLRELFMGETGDAKGIMADHRRRVAAAARSAEIIAEQKRLEGKNQDDLAAEQRAEEERMRAQWDAEDRARRAAEAERLAAMEKEWREEQERQEAEWEAEVAKWARYKLRGTPIPGPARDAKRRQSQGDEFFQTTGHMFFWCLDKLNDLSIGEYKACRAWCLGRKAGRDMVECLDLNPSTVYTWLAIYFDEEIDMIGGSTADFRKYHKDEVDEIKALRVST